MRNQETIINIIFDPGKGYCSVSSREGVVGTPLGELPKPSRSGYAFEGWYLNGETVTAETVLESEDDVRLVAQWAKKKAEAKKPSVMRRQKWVALALAITIVFLGVAIAVANNLVAIYYIRDEYIDANGEKQTERYTLKRQDGLYRMYNKDGVEMVEISEHSYQSSTDGVYHKVFEADVSGNQYMINTSTGEYELFAVVDYDESLGETLGGTVTNKRVMIFPRVGQDDTYSIQVSNQYGSYEIYRQNVLNSDTSTGKKYTTSVQIRGTEGTLATYDPTLFASLCVSCGYTLSLQKLYFTDPETPRDENGNVRYEDYGLENVYDENGNLTYAPAVYTIVKAAYASDGQCSPATETVEIDGQSVERTVEYTVKVGYPVLSGAGYYVQLQGRDVVYIVSADIANTVLQPVESLVTPMVTYPMTMTTYAMSYNFRLGLLSGELEDLPEKGEEIETDDRISLIASFSYKDLTEREGSVESSVPYINELNFMKGYQLDSNSVSAVLEKIYSMAFLGCKKLNPTDEDIKEYGLDKDVYVLMFDYDPAIANGGSDESNWVQNVLMISQRTKDGTHYIYSPLYDMIVEVDQAYLSFLDWNESDWYDQFFFRDDIAYMKNMCFTVDGKTYDFTFDNRFSYAYYDKGDGTGAIIDLSKGTLSLASNGYVYTVTKTGKQYNVYFIDFSKTYRDKSTSKILYKGPGDSGEVTVQVASGSSNLQLLLSQNGAASSVMDYTITVEEDSGYTGTTKTKTYTATDNFRRLYYSLLYYSIEGDADPDLFGGDLASYIKDHDPIASISYSLEDMASILNPDYFTSNNKKDAIIRFYEYPNGSEMHVLLTIQVADANGVYGEELGRFYVLAEELENLGEYLTDLVNGVLLPSNL